MKKIFWIFVGLFLFTLTGCNFSNGDPVVNQQLFDELTTKVNEFNSKIETSDYLSIDLRVEVNNERVSSLISLAKNPAYIEITTGSEKEIYTQEDDKIFKYTKINTQNYDRDFYCYVSDFVDDETNNDIQNSGDYYITEFNSQKINVTVNDNVYTLKCKYKDALNKESKEILEDIYETSNLPIDILFNSDLIITYTIKEEKVTMALEVVVEYEKLPEPINLKLIVEIDIMKFTPKNMLSGEYKFTAPDCFEEVYKTYDYKEVLKLDAYKQAYLRIDAKKGMLVSNERGIKLELYDENYNLITESLGNIDSSTYIPINSLLPIEEDGIYYVIATNRNHDTTKFTLSNHEYDTTITTEGIDISNPIDLEGTIEGKYDVEKLVYINNDSAEKSVRIENLGKQDLVICKIYDKNKLLIDINKIKFITIKPNQANYITLQTGLNELFICERFDLSEDSAGYDYNIKLNIIDFIISDNTIEAPIPSEFHIDAHSDIYYYSYVEKGLYSFSDVNLFGSRLEVKVFDKFGKKVDANVVEYGKWLDDFSRNYIIKEDGWYFIGVRSYSSESGMVIHQKYDYNSIGDKNNPTVIDTTKDITYQGTLEGHHDFEYYKIENTSSELKIYYIENTSDQYYRVILKEYPTSNPKMINFNPGDKISFSALPGSFEIMIVENTYLNPDDNIEYKFIVKELKNNNVTDKNSSNLPILSLEYTDLYYMAGLTLPKMYMKLVVKEKGSVRFQYLDYFTNEVLKYGFTQFIYDTQGNRIYNEILEPGEYLIECSYSDSVLLYAKVKYTFHSALDQTYEVELKELDDTLNDYKYSYIYSEKVSSTQNLKYYFTLEEKTTIMYQSLEVQIFDEFDNIQVLVPNGNWSYVARFLYVDLEPGRYYFTIPGIDADPSGMYKKPIPIGIKNVNRDNPQDFLNMNELKLDEVKEVKQDFEKDFEFLKFTVTETSYYKFDANYLNIYIYNQDKRMVIQIIPWSNKEVYLKEGTYYIVLEHKYVEEPVSEIEVTKK